MIDQERVERAAERFKVPDGAFERLVHRRDRKRRNQRIAAGVVGIAVFVAAVWIVTSSGALDRSTPAVPGGSKTGPAQLAVAVDDGFQGRYRLIAHQLSGQSFCNADYARRVRVRYVNETTRDFYHPRADTTTRFRYVDGAIFPWQGVLDHRDAELRYDPATDTALGSRDGFGGCRYRLRLVPIHFG